MPTFSDVLSSGYRMDLIISGDSQNIAGNYTTVSYTLRIVKTSGSGKWMSGTSTWNTNINGHTRTGTISGYDFRGYTTLNLAAGYYTVYHNADGTKTMSAGATFDDNDTYGEIGDGAASGNTTFATIPRASTPSFSASTVDAGTSVTINTNRASTAFTHTLEYIFGSQTGVIATGVGASTTWTPPLSLLSEIPNATSGTVTVTADTYNGATLIGSKYNVFTLTAPSSVTPDFTTVTATEAVSEVSTDVGAFVKDKSKLNLAITGAAGAYGSTIVSSKIEVAGQTINAASGTTPAVISAFGTVPIVGTITDSRGRIKQKTVNVTVLDYFQPRLNATTFDVYRANLGGTPNPEGLYIRADVDAAVASLVNGTQKNAMTLKLYARERGTTTWTLKSTTTPGITYVGPITTSSYPVEDAWEIKVEVNDVFSTSTTAVLVGTVSTSEIFMHWGGVGEGLGVGKFWDQGGLDVLGQIYQNDGKAVVDETYTGNLTLVNKFWTPNTSEASLSSTAHALQIGPTSGVNLIADNNEVQARNNGAASTLNLNPDGGGVTIGSSSSTVSIPGNIDGPSAPFAQATGSVTSTGSTITTVSFPVGRFTQPPRVIAQFQGGQASVSVTWITNVTTTSFDLRCYTLASASAVGGTVAWRAVQATSSSADG